MTPAIVLMLMGQFAGPAPAPAQTTTVQANQPLEYELGDPIVLRSGLALDEGWQASHSWFVDRPAKGRHFNDEFGVWSRYPGTYEARHEIHLINFGEGKFHKVTEEFTIIIKGEPPPPGPGPGPGPGPEPGPNPPQPLSDLSQKVTTWAQSVQTEDKRGEAQAIAAAFREHAKTANGSDLRQLVRKTAATYRTAIGLNEYIVWREQVLVPLDDEVQRLTSNGLSADSFGALWNAIAKGFEDVQ